MEMASMEVDIFSISIMVEARDGRISLLSLRQPSEGKWEYRHPTNPPKDIEYLTSEAYREMIKKIVFQLNDWLALLDKDI